MISPACRNALAVLAGEGPLSARGLQIALWPEREVVDAATARYVLAVLRRAGLVRPVGEPPDGLFRAGRGPLFSVTDAGRAVLRHAVAAPEMAFAAKPLRKLLARGPDCRPIVVPILRTLDTAGPWSTPADRRRMGREVLCLEQFAPERLLEPGKVLRDLGRVVP